MIAVLVILSVKRSYHNASLNVEKLTEYLCSLEFRSIYFRHAWYPITHIGPSTDPVVRLGGIKAPYRAHRFGNGHLPFSTPFMEDFYSLRSVFTPVVTLTGVVVYA